MAFCLPKEFAGKFLDALKSGKIVPEELASMSSVERRAFLEPIVGAKDVHEVNALLESKLILQDQKRGMVAWAKKVAGLSETRRADIISRIEKLTNVLEPAEERAFLEDLAAKRLGTEVSVEEARNIAGLSKQLSKAQEEYDPKSGKWTSEDARLKYGALKVALSNYVNDLKLENEKTTLKGVVQDFKTNPIEGTKAGVSKLASITKGIQASLDNSALFRQGWRTIFTHPGTWVKNALQSFRDIAAQIGKKPTNNDVINGVKAEIYSRENAMNGIYQKMKLDIGDAEEAFPTTIPERIPLFGRLYKASETAYTGFLYRMRADIADQYIKVAENGGVDLKDAEGVRSIGKMVNSLTGRGDLGSLEKVGKQVNTIFFSPKAVKASFDFLTGHNLQKGVSPFVRKAAAINLLKVVAGTAVIMATAQALLGKNAIELDPRSADFGKIRIGDTRFDISGGMSSLITLAARLGTLSTKSSTTHKVSSLTSGKFGAPTGLDVAFDFATNKASPLASVVVDILRGQTFEGTKPTIFNETTGLFTPLPISNAQEVLSSPNGADPLLTIIADGLGISTNTYTPAKKK